MFFDFVDSVYPLGSLYLIVESILNSGISGKLVANLVLGDLFSIPQRDLQKSCIF